MKLKDFSVDMIMNAMIYKKVCGKVNNELCPCYVRLDLGV
jgi:hypothetical protein